MGCAIGNVTFAGVRSREAAPPEPSSPRAPPVSPCAPPTRYPCPLTTLLLPPPFSFAFLSLPLLPPLQSGRTPLHAAAGCGGASVVALLLATQGVDPTLEDVVRSVQRRRRGPAACLLHTSLPCFCCRMARLRWTMHGTGEVPPQQRSCRPTRALQWRLQQQPRPEQTVTVAEPQRSRLELLRFCSSCLILSRSVALKLPVPA